MKDPIFPCLWFDGNSKQAAKLYTETFGGNITVDTPMVINLELFGQKVMLLDGDPNFQKNASISMMVICLAEQEIDNYWKIFSEKGKVLMPLETYPFAKKYGWLQDEFGTTWQFYFGEISEDAQRFVPQLMFVNQNKGKAQEAMEFYTKIFPNSTIEETWKYGENNEENEDPNFIAHAEFTLEGYRLGCLDSSLEHPFDFSEGISLVKLTENQQETDHYWNSLIADGGAESRCGWLKDKFGVSWQIVPKRLLELGVFAEDQQKGQKAMQAMMKMKKIDIAEIEKAYHS